MTELSLEKSHSPHSVPRSVDTAVSPTHGIVTLAENGVITIYIHATDIHEIHAPVTGYITGIQARDGILISRDIEYYDPEAKKYFKAKETKRGRVKISMMSNEGRFLALWIEVGEGYITDIVKLLVKNKDHVERGNVIGEILVGSLSEVHVNEKSTILVKKNDGVIGGKTPIARLK